MRKIPSLAASTAALLLSPGLALAHPGHSMKPSDLTHILASPYHLAVLGMIGVGLLLAGTWIQRRLPRTAIQGCGVLTLAGTVVLWGMGV